MSQAVRVGMEASGQAQWFDRLLEELRVELVERRCRSDPGETGT
jgi:hypothetical protein